MTHSAAMQKALDEVVSVARTEALMFRPPVATVFGLNIDQIRMLMDFYEESTGLEAHEIGLHRHVIVYAPSERAAEDAIKAHGIDRKKYHPQRVKIVTPGTVHHAFGLSREMPWTVISGTPGNQHYWSGFTELKCRLNNEPSDIRVAFARAGMI